jgi:cytochrome bd-type quinol oxidase subunit 2
MSSRISSSTVSSRRNRRGSVSHAWLVSASGGGATARPFAMTVLAVIFSFLTLAASFWPYYYPYTVTVADAAAPPQSLAFLFWEGGS